MISAPGLPGVVRLLDGRRGDPRAHRRYEISLSVDYKLLSKGRVERLGSGQTLNMSTGGVCFRCMDPLPPDRSIELMMDWPFLLEGVCPLRLVMRGRIVRIDGWRVAVRVQHHEFRTAGARTLRVVPLARPRSTAR
jgi:hypothetical protein